MQPLSDDTAPCGADLEYDNEFLELNKAAEGKPESQFDAGTPPDWRDVRERCTALFERTRDLRVAVIWLRAVVNLDGFAALPQGLRLVHGLLESFWDTLHPLPDPDDGDAYARMNALAVLREQDNGLIGDLRQSVMFNIRGVGDLRVRAIEVALGLLPARDDEPTLSRDQLSQMLAAAVEHDPGLREQPASAMARLKALVAFANDHAGAEGAPDFKPLQALLHALNGVMPAAASEADALAEGAGEEGEAGAAGGAGRGPGRLSGGVNSREEAVRAIDLICDYLEKAEPTNPAQLLLRRARRMINRNFLQLMKELAPDALSEVARVMGVDPDTVQLDEST